MQQLLASGDVDAIRRLLKEASSASVEELRAEAPNAQAPGLSAPVKSVAAKYHAADSFAHSGTLLPDCTPIKLVIGECELQIYNRRVMGKLLWPAGHAVAQLIARVPTTLAASHLAVLEVGAGAAVPSLVAAAIGARKVIATDFTEEGVELIRYNDSLNGRKLTACERLDVREHSSSLELLRQHGLTEADSVLIVACDCSYDPITVTNLFASASQLLVRPGAASPLICFARADLFAHLDDHVLAAAQAHGFALARRVSQRAAGVLDAVSETYLTPCAEDVVETFLFVCDVHATVADELFNGLLWAHSLGEAAPAPVGIATASLLADEWSVDLSP